MAYKNLADMFFQKRQTLASNTAYMYKKEGNWESVSFKDAVDRAEKISAGLASLNIGKGDRVAIISGNRIEWALSDYATMAIGAVLVPIYSSLLPDQVKYILDDSETDVVIVSDELQYEKVEKIRNDLQFTKHFFILDSDNVSLGDKWKIYDDLAQMGEKFLSDKKDFIENSISNIKRSDWATIIYTSGTTGEPKGAILSHNNFLSNIENVSKVVDLSQEDSFLSFLPLSHVFERMAGHFLSCFHGASVAYAESIDTVADNLKEVKPTLMVSVPRLYEKIYAKVIDGVESGSPVKRKIFYWALGVGKEYINKKMMKEPIGSGLQFKYNLGHKLVYHKLHDAIGGRNRFMVSGGAPLSAEIAEFFGGVGIRILEGYGLTETSPVIAVNLLDSFRFGTVGPILPNVEVSIAEDGEILSRGDHIMIEYYKKDAQTKEAIDEEGWFHTGDIGVIEDGFLRITDRKKNILVTAGGKNIAPQPIENSLVTNKYIEQVLMIGDNRKFCSALIVASEETLGAWAEGKGLSYNNYQELVELEGANEMIMAEVENLTKHLATYESIKKIILAKAPFTIESGELTPSLKVKRKVVEKNYAAEIDKMYEV